MVADANTVCDLSPYGVGLTYRIDYSLPLEQWMTNLWFNIREAALEEMRVRAAMLRLVREAPCSSCGAASTSVVCSTPVCRFHAGPKTCPYAAHHQPCDCNGEGGDR